MEESFGSIRKVWMEAGTTYCTSIPLEIAKRLELEPQDMLYVDLVDDLIVMKKHKAHLSKTEIQKTRDASDKLKTDESKNARNNSTDTIIENKEESNPLDGYEF